MNYAQIREYDVTNGPNVRTTLFVSGCTNNCASYQQYKYNKGVVHVKDSGELDKAIIELKKLMED